MFALASWPAAAVATPFTQFEARQTHSVAITPDGTRLLALNSPAASLSVFDVSNAGAAPVLLTEIPVGLEPVSVRVRTNDEAWVVNEVGDSVSIVSLSRLAVVATLAASDEPGDVVFAQGKAFVSCARNRLLRVFDATTRVESAPIELAGLDPRALAVDPSGAYVYAAFLLSGNRTTILSRNDAPPQPDPTNPSLPDPPITGLIVPTNDPRITQNVVDRDIAKIEAGTGQVTGYYGGVGTILFDLAIHPTTGELWVANTEALNLIRFEPVLRGHFADSRLTRVNLGSSATEILDLNAGVDYSTLPNAAAQATALTQPTGLAFAPDGSLWVAAFASDRVARLDSLTGQILNRIDLRVAGDDSTNMRGPRSLALHPTQPRLFVLNKISDTLTVIATETNAVSSEVPLSTTDWMPANIRSGRGFLFDARLSGNGTNSCAVCHVDADRDGLAWDLGDPNGQMASVLGADLAAHILDPKPRIMHPMKGPMITQTLRGLSNGAPFHWRGDRASLQSFNPTFANLMGGPQLSGPDINLMADYLFTLRHHPNPNRTKTGDLPPALPGDKLPVRGEILFNLHDNHCGICHIPPKGTDNNIDSRAESGSEQSMKNPSLATVYQRLNFNPRPGEESLSGFGLLHDGAGYELPTAHPYVLDTLKTAFDFVDVQAYVLCFETGTWNAVGDSTTVTAQNAAGVGGDLARLEGTPTARATLVVRGVIGGVQRKFIYSSVRKVYISADIAEAPLSRAGLLALLGPNDSLTFMGVQPSEGGRFSGSAARAAVARTDSYFIRSPKVPLTVPATTGLMANDLNVDTAHDMVMQADSSTLGTTVLNADGSFTYTPGSAFAKTGRDRFTYQLLLASDPGSASEAVQATINSMAVVAGKYNGTVQLDASQAISGFAKISVSSSGSWSGSVKIGAKTVAIKGTVGADGKLNVSKQPLFAVNLALSVLPDNTRQIALQVTHDGGPSSGVLPGNPYSSKVKAPAAGKHKLVLSVASSIGTAPIEPGSATLTIGKTGTASISGKLGDKTKFSYSGVLSPTTAGGWRFMVYSSIYKYPAGSVAGEVAFAPAQPLVVEGSLLNVKPPQTRTGPYQTGFTVDYDVNKATP